MSLKVGLVFHGIGTPKRDLEHGEASCWISVQKFVDILDWITTLPDPSQVHISFDDGNLSDIEIALPHLIARGLQAEFFVVTGRIGTAGSLSVSNIQDLQAAGMEIGSHGVDHVDWRKLNRDQLASELEVSRDRLADICGRTIVSAAIPYGEYNGRVFRGLKEAGYTSAYNSDTGKINTKRLFKPRTSIRETTDIHNLDWNVHNSGRLYRVVLAVAKKARRTYLYW